MASENVCSVEKENKLGFYRLHTIFNDDFLKINVTSKDGAWTGQVSKSKLEEMGQDVQRPADVYIKETLEALTAPGGKPGVVYAVEDNNFVWKAVDNEIGMKIRLGGIPLQPSSFVDTIQNMMQVSLNQNVALQETISRLERDKITSEQSVNAAIQKLNDFAKSKQAMEDDLYATFISVLNAKKNKIKELEVELIAERTRIPQIKTQDKKKSKKRPKDPYDDDTESDNSDQEPSSSKSPRRTRASKAPAKGNKRSTRKVNQPKITEVAMLSSSDNEEATKQDEQSLVQPSTSKYVSPTHVHSLAVPLAMEQVEESVLQPLASSDVSTTNTDICTVPSTSQIDPVIDSSLAQPCKNSIIPDTESNQSRSSEVGNRSKALLDDLFGGPLKESIINNAMEKEVSIGFVKDSSIQSTTAVRSSKARDIIDEFF